MKEQVRQLFSETIARVVQAGLLPPAASGVPFVVEAPRSPEHGDYAVNAALVLAKPCGMPPRKIAELLKAHLADPKAFSAVEIAGPGFLNVKLRSDAFFRALRIIAEQDARFGRVQLGNGRRVLVEYVSANPTGPMHVGHGRGAVTGDAISRILDAAGWSVEREYYVNDAGGQVTALARSVWIRAREHYSTLHPDAGLEPIALGEDDYKGEYVLDVAKVVLERWPAADREAFVRGPFPALRDRIADVAVQAVIETMIKPDLERFGIHFDRFFSEKALHASGAIEKSIEDLRARGFVEEKVLPPPKGIDHDPDAEARAEGRPQLVFLSSRFGDDADRPLRKSDGTFTYFAADVAYHWDKLQRGHDRLVNVFGADHGGYVPRMKAAVQALGRDANALEIPLVQMVNLLKGGQAVKMGKRSGNFVTLRWLLEEVGADAVRVFFLTRKGDAMFDFDLDLAKTQSKDNPVFYVQYGHARCAAILRMAAEKGMAPPAFDPDVADALSLPEEHELVKTLLAFPSHVAGAAEALEPHRIVYYVQELTAQFQRYYEVGKRSGEKVISDDPRKTAARLFLIACCKRVFGNALALLGVSAPERMIREEAEEATT